jgi:hypothetical protein
VLSKKANGSFGSTPAVRSGARERRESARLGHYPEPRRRSLDRTDTSRSALVAGTGLHAPLRPLVAISGNGLDSPLRHSRDAVLAHPRNVAFGSTAAVRTTHGCFSTASVSRPSVGATVSLLSAKGGSHVADPARSLRFDERT